MSSLDKFIDIITLAKKPISNGHTAYKMDSTTAGMNMRSVAGLGTCQCCDYFFVRKDSIVLLEETQLLREDKNIRAKYTYLSDADLDDLVIKIIGKEMQLKAYGAMLILCRLAAKCVDAKTVIQNKKYSFWLVASAINTPEDMILFDNMRDSLQGTLTGVLSKKLLNNVAVIPSEALANILSGENPAR